MKKKDSFILYHDMWSQLSQLSNEELGIITRMMFEYQTLGEINNIDRLTQLVFCPIKTTFDRDAKKWNEEVSKRSIAGKEGGLAKASNAKKKMAKPSNATKCLANLADSVSVPVSVPVSEETTETDNFSLSLSETSEIIVNKPKKKKVVPVKKDFNLDIFIGNQKETFAGKIVIPYFVKLGWIPSEKETFDTFADWYEEIIPPGKIYSNIQNEKEMIIKWYNYWITRKSDEDFNKKNWKTTFANTWKFNK